MRFRHFLLASAVSAGLLLAFTGRAASPGDLIRGASSSAVYYVNDDGKRLGFSDEATFFTWYPDFSTVRKITDRELAAIPFGGQVTPRPGIKMVKIKSDPKIYAIARGGVLRWIKYEWVAAVIFGTDWNKKVLDVSDAFFVNYTIGDPIDNRNQYWWAQERDAAPSIHVEQATKATYAPVSSTANTTPSATTGELTVEVNVVNDNGGTANAGDFAVFVDGKRVSSGVTATYPVGAHKLTSTDKTGYATWTWGGACTAGGSVTIEAGKKKSCAIVFNDIRTTAPSTTTSPTTSSPPSTTTTSTDGILTLIHTVVNDNGGTASAGDFSMRIGNDATVNGSAVALAPGTHTVTILPRAGYLTGSWTGDCAANGTVTLATGNHKTCRVTSDDTLPSVPALRAATITKNILVILWDPHRPTEPAPSKDYIDRVVFGSGPSVADFYRNQSFGKVQIHKAGLLGWYAADKPADHYWNHPADANDGFISGHVEKWAEAIKKADAEFDFSAYDTNHDGILSASELGILIVIPQNQPFGTNRWVVAQETPTSEPLVVDGVTVGLISEVYAGSDTGFSIYAHEEGHLLFGFPDMYDDPHPLTRPFRYSLMDFGYSNVQLDPYNKYWQDWLTTKEITTDGYYLVNDVQKYHEVLKTTKPGDPKEFFLIENRQHGAYDVDILDTGIEVWSIYDERTGDWGRDNVHVMRPTSSGDSAWHGPAGPNGYDLHLKWRDGTTSGITISEFPASSPSMSIHIDLP